MKSSEATILVLPGLGGGTDGHWYARWQAGLKTAEWVALDDWASPAREAYVASILAAVAGNGTGRFYRVSDGVLEFATRDGGYAPVPVPEGVLRLSDVKRRSKRVDGNGSASLWDLGDGVLCLEFHTKMNAIDPGVLEMVAKSTEIVRSAWCAYVNISTCACQCGAQRPAVEARWRRGVVAHRAAQARGAVAAQQQEGGRAGGGRHLGARTGSLISRLWSRVSPTERKISSLAGARASSAASSTPGTDRLPPAKGNGSGCADGSAEGAASRRRRASHSSRHCGLVKAAAAAVMASGKGAVPTSGGRCPRCATRGASSSVSMPGCMAR